MAIQQLKHYIPLSAPSTRELATGEESDFRLSLGFTPGWFSKHLGIDFSEKWHQNPVYRYETMVKMKGFVRNKFPYLEQFQPRLTEAGAEVTCATISGVYGTCSISAIYGLPVIFHKDNWPETSKHYTKEQLSKLKPINVEEIPFVQQLMEQMDEIETRYGVIDGYLGYQGILNNAFRLMGQEIFVEMLEDVPFVEFLFEHIYETMLQFIKLVQKRQNQSGFPVNFLSVSNCVINMIGTELYEELLLPYDQRFAKEFGAFGIHTCNWDITKYIESFQTIENLGYLDMGMMSDMRKAREIFPDTRFAVLYHPMLLEKKSMEEIQKDFQYIYEQAAPVDLALADVDVNVSNERLQTVVKLAHDMEQKCRKGYT